MFCCPRALSIFSGVVVCALISGCAHEASSTVATRQACPPLMQPALVADPRTSTTVISADATAQLARPVSCEDIINWSCRGTSDDIIIDRLEHSSNVFHISAAEEIHLRDAGVSDEVIRAMKATAS
jgi:hypothetical protein